MKKYLVICPNEYHHFRKDEILSIGKALEIPTRIIDNELIRDPDVYLEAEFPSDEKASMILKRSVTAKSVNVLWGRGKNWKQVMEFFKSRAEEITKNHTGTFRVDFVSMFFKIKSEEKRGIVEEVNSYFSGKIKLKNPDFIISIYFIHNVQKKLQEVLLMKELGRSSRGQLMDTYDLKKRYYLGTTSMPAFYSFLMANMALATPKTFIYDPFIGTASILISCSAFGSYVMGSDIDVRILRGKKKGKNIFSNFDRYDLTKNGFDVLRGDFTQLTSHECWTNKFDAVVTDPPYGLRESCSKIGRKRYVEVPPERHHTHIPSRVPYSSAEMICDLLNFSARGLVPGGRLVYWLAEVPGEVTIPSHPSMRVDCAVLDIVNSKVHRRLITMTKVREFEEIKPDSIVLPDLRAFVFDTKHAKGEKSEKSEKGKGKGLKKRKEVK